MANTSGESSGESSGYSIDTLNTKIGDLQTTASEFTGNLNSFQSNISNVLNNSCFSGSGSGNCNQGDFTDLKTTIDTLTGEIGDIKSQTSQLTQDLTTNNYLINGSLSQLNTGYQINNQISNKNIDTIIQQSDQLQEEAINKQRMTEINYYYTNMNTYLNTVLRNLVIVLAVIIVINVLSKRGIIPEVFATPINIIGVLGIVVYVIYTVYDINIRDRLNFNEYVIPFDLTAEKMESIGDPNNGGFTDIRKVLGRELIGGIDEIQNLTDTCIGDSCCEPGTIYDLSSNACIIKCDSGQVYYKTTDSNGNLIGKCR